MFLPRLVSGIVMVILALVLIICGGNILLFSTLLISLIGMFELYRVFQIEKTSLAIVSYLVTGLFYCNLAFHWVTDPFVFVMGLLILLMFIYVFTYPRYETKHIMAAFFGMFYVGVMLSYIYQIRMLGNGVYLAVLVFICSWGCDTFAYCVGMLIGKHKMSPLLSPKKSIEGAVGGVFGAALLTLGYALLFQSKMGIQLYGIIILSVIAAIAGLISMVGDLCASAIKRNYDIKDYGKLIPGHGGIMDRFDSVMITAPIIYYLATFLM